MILHTILFVFFFWSMYHISLEWWMVKFDVFVPPCKICFNTTNIYAYPFFGTNIYIYIYQRRVSSLQRASLLLERFLSQGSNL